MFPPDGLLTLDESKGDVNPHIIAPDPFGLDDSLNVFSPPHQSLLTKTDKLDMMSAGEDEPLSGLNGRLRPRKSNVIKPDFPKVVRKDTKPSLDRSKRSSTPSKASLNKQDDLVEKSDMSLSTQFLCAFCNKKFASKQTVLKHARRIHLTNSKQDNFINCLFCNHGEANSSDIFRHMVDSHPNQYFACLDCHSRFSSTSELSEHKLNACDKPKISYRNKLRQNIPATKKKKSQKNTKDYIVGDTKEFQEGHDFNGIVISCELKPSQGHNEDDIEDNITTNLILPSGKSLPNNASLEKNALIVLDDLQWNKRIPSNFSFHNSDTDQILSRLGVVHRSPRNPEPTKREWLKLIDASTQKFERCFDTSFYTKVASNVQENLTKFLDGSFNFNPDPENIINTRKSKNSVVINTAEGFPILLASEQYSRNVLDGYLPRAIAPKHKWKWDNNDAEKVQLNPDQIKRDFHTNKCIITLISSLDIWTQLCMRRKYEEKFNSQPVEEKTEKQNALSRELKEILESREIPSTSQVVTYKNKPVSKNDGLEFPLSLGLTPVVPNHDIKPAVLSGEWVRPRCYVCCACGAQTRDSRGLTSHMSTQHPNAQVQHYEIVGDLLLNSDILKHLYVPPSQVANRTRPLRGIRDCTKCKKSITLEDLHQHMLDCAGDTPTVRRRQGRYRPFGVRKRRPRLPDNTVRKKIRKEIRNRQRRQKTHMRSRPRIRTEVGDAETIRKMLADLPAKRHRVLVNPSNQMSRPRRKLERQRNKIMMIKAKSSENKSKDMNSSRETDIVGNNESSNNDEPADNSSDDDNKKISRSLRAQANRVRQLRNTRQSQALKRKAVINQAKKRSLRLREQNTSNELIETPSVRPNTSKINTDKMSVDNQPKRIDVKVGAYNTREQANRGGNNNRANDREEQLPENNESNANNNNAPPPTQNVPLKHSIARLTAETERHDKSVQFHHLFLVQQECNNTDQHDLPSRQHMLFENEPALTRLDKPPLDCHKKGSIDLNKINKQNKLRKGLNDCIAMLKNKLTDPEPSACVTAHAPVQCVVGEVVDVHVPVVLPLTMPPVPITPVAMESIPMAPVAIKPVPIAPVAMEPVPEPTTPVLVAPPDTTPVAMESVPMAPVSMEPVPEPRTPVFVALLDTTPVSVSPVPTAPVAMESVPTAPVAMESVPIAPVATEPVPMSPVDMVPAAMVPAAMAPVTMEPVPMTPKSMLPVPKSPVALEFVPMTSISMAPVFMEPVHKAPEPTTPVSTTRVSVTPEPLKRVPIPPEPMTSVTRLSITPPIEIDAQVVPPLPTTPISMIPLPTSPNLKYGVRVELSQIESKPKTSDEIIPSVVFAKRPYRHMLLTTPHQEICHASLEEVPKPQLHNDSAKRKSHRSQSYTHHDLHVNIPIQLNPEVVIIPKKSSKPRSFVSPPQVSSKVRTRRDSVPQRSPTNAGAELHMYGSDMYSPGKQQTPTNVLPEIDVFWKNPLEIKPTKKCTVSPKPKSIESPSHSGNINLLMPTEILRSYRQMISPEIAIPYETQILYRQEDKAYSNFNLDNCAPANPPAQALDPDTFVPTPLDLSARIMAKAPTPYLMCNYEGYEMLDYTNKYQSTLPKLKNTHPHSVERQLPCSGAFSGYSQFMSKNTDPPLSSDPSTEMINDDIVDLRVVIPPTDLSINTRVTDNYGDLTSRAIENIPYSQDTTSYRKHKRNHESLRSFRNDNIEIQTLPVSGEKIAQIIPSTECQIMLPNTDNISDKPGTVNFASRDMHNISESEYQRNFRTASHDEKYLSRRSNILHQSEKEYQIRAVTEKLLYGYNQRLNDSIRQKSNWHNKPATITSGSYASSIPTELLINYTKHGQHEDDILKNGSGDRMCSLLSGQVIENRASLQHLQNLKYTKNPPALLTEDNLHVISRADNKPKTETDMQPEEFKNNVPLELKVVTEKDRGSNNDFEASKSIKAQPLNDAKCNTPKEILPEQTGLIDKTPSIKPQDFIREASQRRLSEYDNTSHDSTTSPVPLSELRSVVNTRNLPLSISQPSESSIVETDVTKIRPRTEVSFSISKITSNETSVNSKIIDFNKSQTPEESNKLQDQDLDTAKKFAMLPKELVDILGNIPATHRDQLLNILPQYVSAARPATVKSDVLKETNAVPHLESNTQYLDQTPDVLNLSQSLGLQLTSQNITGQSILNDKMSPTRSSLTQQSQSILINSEEETKPVLDLSIENYDKSESKFESHLDQSTEAYDEYKGNDSVRVIDLTEDDILPNNEMIKTAEEIPNIATLPCQDMPNLVTVEKPSKQKKSNDQTASLRAVRIKTQSERHKHQMSNPAVSEIVSPPIIVSVNDRDNYDINVHDSSESNTHSDKLTKFAIQRSEISSTQHKKILLNSLSPPIISPNQQSATEENVHDKAQTVPTELVSLIQNESARETLNVTETKSSITSPLVAHASAASNESNKGDVAKSKTCKIGEEIKQVEKSHAEVDVKDSTIEVDKCLVVEIKMPLLDGEKVVSYKSDQDDDSEDDISLAKIVEQKQRSDFEKKIEKDAETIIREPLRSLTTRKRKKEKHPKKSNKKLQKVTDISEEVMVDSAKQPIVEIIKNVEETKPTPNIDLITESSSVKDPKKKNTKLGTTAESKSKRNKIDIVLKIKCSSEEKSCDAKPDKYSAYNPNASDDSKVNNDESNETTTMKENMEMNNIQKEKLTSDINYDYKNVKQKDNSKKKKRLDKGLDTLKSNELVIAPDVNNYASNETTTGSTASLEPEVPSTSTALPCAPAKQDKEGEKCVRVSTELTQHSDTTDQITSKIFDESSLTPLRRSKRGKSLFMENEATEYEISINNECSLIHKVPITKKQLIFSKLLLDEDVQSKFETTSLNLSSDNVVSNEDQDKRQEEDKDEKESENCIDKKCKQIKRKKSSQLKRKIKREKSVNTPMESKIKMVNELSPDDSEVHYPEINNKKIRLESDDLVLSQKSVAGVETIIAHKKSTIENNSQHMVNHEKRKMHNVISASDNTHYPKPKKSKTSQDIVQPHNDDFKNKCDDISTEITPSTCLGVRATCYNMQVAAKQTRLKSSSVKGTSEILQYDPYDIDLDDSDFITEPFRKNISVPKDPDEMKSQDFTDSPVEDSAVLKNSGKDQESGFSTNIEDSATMEVDDITVNNSHPVQKETEKNNKKPKNVFKKTLKKAKSAGTKQRKLMKNKLKGYTPRKSGKKNKLDVGDSDDSSKSDVPLKKYVQRKERYHQTEFTLIVEKVRIDTDESESKNSKQCQQNDSPDSNKITEASTALADKYMENFGFYSERKPRKSNLLATKKISETFHIIANESDEEKSRKRSTNTESRKSSEEIPECNGYHICVSRARRGRKKRSGSDDDYEEKCYCGLCKKEFRRPDTYIRHKLTLLHIARIAEVQFKIRTTLMVEEPSYLIVYKQQVERVRMLIQKQVRRKKSKKIKVPTLEEILEAVRKVVRAQQLKQRGLSNDEALFLDCCELLQEGPQTKPEAVKIETVQLNTVNNMGISSSSVEFAEKFDSRSDGDVDSITARNILESEEVRNLENDLISGLKEAAQAKQAEYQQSEPAATISNEKRIDDLSSPDVDTHFEQTGESDVSEEIATTSKNQYRIPEYKEKMYPDIDDIDMFEDKFDKIKRKCRSQAAAAKQTQSLAEPSSRHKSRKKSDRKKIKKLKKNYQNTVLTKGALKGFDGIKVSIPTTDINIAAIVPQADISSKKKKKAYSKKKREKKDSVTVTEKPKESSVRTKKLDVYEFMDNEEAELFEFRPSTLMERFKSITSKENKSRENSKSNVVPDDVDNLSENGSDGDDFVYMSDDYVCSDEETESSLLSEVGNKIDTKKNTLKKKDIVEKNAVMGKIFKHNAVRCEKKVSKSMDPVEPKANLDQLFDSLLEDEPSSSMLHDDSISKKDDCGYSSSKKLANSMKDATPEGRDDSLLKQSPALTPEPYETCTPSTSGVGRYEKVAEKTFEDDYVIDFGPSTSKKADELYANMTRKMLYAKSKTNHSSALCESPLSDNYKMTFTESKLSKQKSPSTKLEESFDFDDFNAEDTGVARQRARRKCTVGKQNVLAETWSSESEPDGIPPRPNSTESVVASSARKRKGKKKDGQNSTRRSSKNIGKKHEVESRVNNSNRNNTNSSGEGRFSGGVDGEESVEKAEYSPMEFWPPETVTSEVAGPSFAASVKARPRSTAYYSWSSEGDEEPEHVQQHGWIVGDSHKKLVTMLAHAKGRKRNNDEKRHLVE